jgi:hypothetical protein
LIKITDFQCFIFRGKSFGVSLSGDELFPSQYFRVHGKGLQQLDLKIDTSAKKDLDD